MHEGRRIRLNTATRLKLESHLSSWVVRITRKPGEPRAVRDRPAFECLLENDLRRTSVGEGVAPAERSYLHSAKCGERGTFIDSWRARFREARGRVATGIANRSHSTADFAKGVATLPPASRHGARLVSGTSNGLGNEFPGSLRRPPEAFFSMAHASGGRRAKARVRLGGSLALPSARSREAGEWRLPWQNLPSLEN